MRSFVHVATATAVAVVLLAGCSDGGGVRASRSPANGRVASSGDFNGDGYDDFATTVRPTSVSRGPLPSRLAVVYGSSRGLDPHRRLVVDGPEDDYAGPLLRVDLDRDGFTDLVTARWAHGATPDAERTGQTVVLRGGPKGLGRPRTLGGDGLTALATGDFNGDGAPDLLAAGHTRRTGTARVLYGPFDATTGKPARGTPLPRAHGTPHGKPTKDHDQAPSSATAGDFDGDQRSDLVLTYRQDAERGATATAPADLTPVVHYRGGSKGLVRDSRPEARLIHALETADGPGEPAAGDVDDDGIDDLLAPGEGPVVRPTGTDRDGGGNPARTPERSGGLTVVRGAKSGLGRGRSDWFLDQSAPGVPGEPRGDDGFGATPAVGDVTADGRPDLVVAAPEKGRRGGRLTLLPGSGLGGKDGRYTPPTSDPDDKGKSSGRERARTIDLDTPGVPGSHTPYGFDAFAPQPPLLDVDGDGHDDVIATAPGYGRGGTGGFWVFRGTGEGLTTTAVTRFTPAALGIRYRTR
uniref:VCBS repeat-containing protein n=1 Tax=Streptomyces violaceusniger TaxID=68280 RepID=A0A6F8Z291_STRVO|nr:VCBS repeat-containing protein [Streptomyces violaceusniger]